MPNGITTGIELKKAMELDASLVYDDWDEDYQSTMGYWLEDDVEIGTVLSISVFIKEVLDNDVFDQCNW